ncbi:MAG: hypothetical protein E3J90_10430 [Promethearchaeota archaeon]|nr:MAG: hypothetical protein E3J90_10430 [Candidatus Lokiarchaeota archaeon]
MITKKNSKIKTQILTMLFVIVLTSAYISFSTKFFDSSLVSERFGEDIREESDILPLNENPVLSDIGYDEWWNSSFLYRRLINITNVKVADLEDYIVWIEFNYTEMLNDNKINSSLKDLRIVEKGILREYFVQKDYPQQDFATVWFLTNCTASSSELDTYLYYGNNNVEHDTNYYNKDNRFGLAWYTFDEGSGNPKDSTENYVDGTLINMEAGDWVDGKVGEHSLRFDGINEYVNLPSINPTSAITVSAWIKSGSASYYSGVWQMISKYNAYILGTYSSNSNRMAFIIYSGGWRYDSYYDVPDPDEWHLFIGTYDSSSGQKILYMDGEFKDDYFTSGTINPDTGPLTIAKREPYSNYFDGWMDDVRIYDYALSQDEIDGLYNYSNVNTVLQEEQSQFSEVTIITYDVDGRIIPNALVSLVNYTTGQIIPPSKNTAIDGSVVFQDLDPGQYNITVNYTLPSGKEIVVYNSSETNEIYDFSGLYYDVDIELNLWTIDFEIVDWDNFPLNYAYINVSDTEGGEVLETLRLNEGKATFRWKNDSKYYYEIFYDNADYNTIPIPLNKSYIYRSVYDPGDKLYNHLIWVNNTNIMTGTEYRVLENIYTNGAAQIGNKKLLKANITLAGMTDFLDTVQIYYIDKNGGYGANNLIYFNDTYSGAQQDFIEINIRNPQTVSSNLIADNFEAYGLRIDVRGFNSTTLTQCNGTIQVLTVEASHIYNKTSLAKLQIRVIDVQPGYIPVQSCIIKVNNSAGNTITSLITDSDGYAHGQINSESEFWFSRVSNTENYTFILNFYDQDKSFEVNVSDQYKPGGFVMAYNYTLTKNATLVFKIQIDISQYKSQFTDVPGDVVVNWGDNFTFSVNYTVSENNGASWSYLNDPDDVICVVGSDNSKIMTKGVGNGVFTVTFNSSVFSAGYGSELYWVEISGSKLGYIDPDPVYFSVTINALPTALSIHDYDALTIYPNNLTSEYWNELFNLTVRYQDISGSNVVRDASLSYDWLYGSGTINPDPINDGYYTFTINTSVAPAGGQYQFEITATKENYTQIQDFDFDIIIEPRPTLLNGSTDIIYLSTDVWIEDAQNFTFEYTDTLLGNKIGDLTINSYTWQKLDTDKQPISGEEGVGALNQTADNIFILDFDTETKALGNYYIFIQLKSDNYDLRTAIIDLEIKQRTIDHVISATGLSNLRINVVQGVEITITLELKDKSRNMAELTGANVSLTLSSSSTPYSFVEVTDGTYELDFPTENIDAFFMQSILTGDIEISKEDFETETISITIVIGMTEIFPGFPMFWFIMIVGAIIAVAGSLIAYRTILRARIPTFVKKVREMSKNIKGRKSISDSLLYPSKDQFIVKKLGDRWEALGLSLDEILGLDVKRKKKLPETTDFEGGKM